jgi:hypothetical protein
MGPPGPLNCERMGFKASMNSVRRVVKLNDYPALHRLVSMLEN